MSKRIGILTFHRAYNYGSVLQAYALNKYVRDRGFTAETIDFHTQNQADIYKFFEPAGSLLGIARNAHSLFRLRSLKLKKKDSTAFLRKIYP